MRQETYFTDTPSATRRLGEKLAKRILKTAPCSNAFVIGLIGDLGSGKTTFLQGFSKGLGVKEKILSPTFVILKRFQLNNLTIKQFNNFYHIDCYRIKKSKELLELGFKEIISEPKNIVAVEWVDRVRKVLPKDALIIKFDFIAQNTRRVKIKQWNKKKRSGSLL
ncbi:hypothetical protein AMJ49_03685 [Parcubacteria bacterium DG_74_2]|nr:MAG: hypothetical protein AMJ49_03685 [Parcubacteria bacterium DG_74_2]